MNNETHDIIKNEIIAAGNLITNLAKRRTEKVINEIRDESLRQAEAYKRIGTKGGTAHDCKDNEV